MTSVTVSGPTIEPVGSIILLPVPGYYDTSWTKNVKEGRRAKNVEQNRRSSKTVEGKRESDND